jgi:raffinose/stachyose/melibiose transport system permease protein
VKTRSKTGEQRFSYWILVLPAVLIYFAVMAFPTVFSVLLSLTNYNGGKIFGNSEISFVGIGSYLSTFKDEYFYLALKNNMYIVLVSVVGQIPLGFILAYILSRGLIKGNDFFQSMIYVPNVISTVVIGILFRASSLTRIACIWKSSIFSSPGRVYHE